MARSILKSGTVTTAGGTQNYSIIKGTPEETYRAKRSGTRAPNNRVSEKGGAEYDVYSYNGKLYGVRTK